MPYLTHELLKNCTTLWKLDNISGLCSSLCGTKSEVYGLKAEFGFPAHLIPKNTNDYIAYIGIRKKKLHTSYGQAHFITFYHEPKKNEYDRNLGILEYMYNIYMDEKSSELINDEMYDDNEKVGVELFPYKITPETVQYWKYTMEDDWKIMDKLDLDDLIDDYEIRGHVDWIELYTELPENIDDDITELDDSEDEMDFNEEETDDEIEEGEIVSESET